MLGMRVPGTSACGSVIQRRARRDDWAGGRRCSCGGASRRALARTRRARTARRESNGRRRTGTGTAARARAPRCRTSSSPGPARPASPAAKAKAEQGGEADGGIGAFWPAAASPWARIAALCARDWCSSSPWPPRPRWGLLPRCRSGGRVRRPLRRGLHQAALAADLLAGGDGDAPVGAAARARHRRAAAGRRKHGAARRRLFSRQVRAVPRRARGGAGRHRQEHAAAARARWWTRAATGARASSTGSRGTASA